MKRTELELTRMSSAKLLAILHKYNPFGGYSIGYRKGQLTRNQAIATILRYEQTARSERERVIAELIAKYGNFPDLIRDVCGTAWNAAIDAAAKAQCKACADGIPLRHVSWHWTHEITGIGIGPCYAAAIHEIKEPSA